MAMNPRLLRPLASGFNPKTIAGLQLWLDGDDASTITLNGSNVSQWNDKSGAGRNVSQAVSGSQPAYVTGSLNGRSGLDWGPTEGTAKRLSRESISVTVRDIFIVADWDGGATSTSFGSVFTPSGVGQPIGLESGTANWRHFAVSDRVQINNAASSTVALPAISNPFVLRSTYTSAAAASACTAIHVGQFATFNTRGWAGKIYEILVYDSSLSASQSSAVQKYLSRKWGITLA